MKNAYIFLIQMEHSIHSYYKKEKKTNFPYNLASYLKIREKKTHYSSSMDSFLIQLPKKLTQIITSSLRNRNSP